MVFAPEVIQPLFDLANPEHPLHLQYHAAVAAGTAGGADGSGGSNGMNTSALSHDSPGPMSHDDHGSSAQTTDAVSHTIITISLVPQCVKIVPQSSQKGLDPNTIRQLQQFQQLLMRQTSGSDAHGSGKDQVKFNKKLLDFDYGSEEDDDKNSPSVPSTSLPDGNNIAQILSDPNVLKQLQNLQKLKQHEMEEKQTKLTEMRLQEEKFEKHLASVLKVASNIHSVEQQLMNVSSLRVALCVLMCAFSSSSSFYVGILLFCFVPYLHRSSHLPTSVT